MHCEDRTKTFKEAYRLLKPGGRLVAMEYVLLDGWKPEDPEQQRLMRLHLHGNGAAKTPTIEEDLAMIKAAGFEVSPERACPHGRPQRILQIDTSTHAHTQKHKHSLIF